MKFFLNQKLVDWYNCQNKIFIFVNWQQSKKALEDEQPLEAFESGDAKVERKSTTKRLSRADG